MQFTQCARELYFLFSEYARTADCRLVRLRIARSTARVADDDEIFGRPLHLAVAAIDAAPIDGRCRTLAAPAIVDTAIGDHLKPVLFRKHVAKEIERVAEPAPDNHQIRLRLRKLVFMPSASKQVAKDAASRSEPPHVAFHYMGY